MKRSKMIDLIDFLLLSTDLNANKRKLAEFILSNIEKEGMVPPPVYRVANASFLKDGIGKAEIAYEWEKE